MLDDGRDDPSDPYRFPWPLVTEVSFGQLLSKAEQARVLYANDPYAPHLGTTSFAGLASCLLPASLLTRLWCHNHPLSLRVGSMDVCSGLLSTRCCGVVREQRSFTHAHRDSYTHTSAAQHADGGPNAHSPVPPPPMPPPGPPVKCVPMYDGGVVVVPPGSM